MKSFFRTVMLTGVATMWSCTSDFVPQQPQSIEEATRAFVEEFGANALGHPMSEASGITLKIVTSTPSKIRVMYDEGDHYCLAGNLSVPAGETDLPFIVPASVDELLIETVSGTYKAKVGTTFNLDEARRQQVASRAPYPATEGRIEVRFKTNRLLSIWNEGVPLFEKTTQPMNLYMNPASVTTGTISFDHTEVVAYAPDGTRVDDHLRTYVVFRGLNRGAYCGTVTYDGYDYNGISAVSNYGTFNTTDGEEYYHLVENVRNSEKYSYNQEDTQYVGGYYNTGFGHVGYHLFPMNFNVGEDEESTLYPNGWTNSHLYWNTTFPYLDRFNVGYVMYKPNQNLPYEIYQDGEWVECSQSGVFTGFSFPPREYNQVMNGKDHYLGYNPGNNVDFNNIVFLTVSIDPADRVEMEGTKERKHPKKVVGNSFLIAAEDLGGSYDWDFNDAVFAVDCVTYSATDMLLLMAGLEEDENKDYPTLDDAYFYNISVKPLAAGGTLPLYIAYNGIIYNSDYTKYANQLYQLMNSCNNFNALAGQLAGYNIYSGNAEDGTWILGNEIHKWFGRTDTSEMINTGDKVELTAPEVRFFAAADPRDIGSVKSETNSPLHNFSIIVDKEENISLSTTFPYANPRGAFTKFEGSLGENGYVIGSVSLGNKSAAPMMLYVSQDWLWPREQTPITDAYGGFAPWLRGETSEWENSTTPSDMSKVTLR